MNNDNPEHAMTFGELLELIHDQQRRINVLETAFSYLAFGLEGKSCQLLIHSLKLEANNQTYDTKSQEYFAKLAEQFEVRNSGVSETAAIPNNDNI